MLRVLSIYLYHVSLAAMLGSLVALGLLYYSRRVPNKSYATKDVRRQAERALLIIVLFGLFLGMNLSILASLISSVIIGSFGHKWLSDLIVRRRAQAFDLSLIDGLTTLAASLKAGLNLREGIEVAANNGTSAFNEELSMAMKEMHLGKSVEDALFSIRQRVRSPNADMALGALSIGNRLGGDLPRVLKRIEATMRERIRVEGKLQALTAQGRTQAMMLGFAPILVAGGMYLWSPERFSLMTSTTMGQMLLVLAVVLEAVGLYVTKRMLTLDV